MPITPCFDPTTGASGGAAPGGAGASFSNVSLRTIDPSSWSTTDPDGLLKSVTHASGSTTFTFNASSGSANYLLTSSTQNFPRRYTDLQADNGDGERPHDG